MNEPRPTATTFKTPKVQRPRVTRRRYLLDPKRQLRTALMTTSIIVALILTVNLGFTLLRTSQTAFLSAAAPQLSPVLEEQDATFSLTMIVISIGLVILVALITIVHTHRTAGAVYAVRQRFERVTAGDLQVTLRLRQRDNLQDLEAPFNEMIGALRNRTLKEAKSLEQLALRAAKIGSDGDDIAAALNELARHKRQIGS